MVSNQAVRKYAKALYSLAIAESKYNQIGQDAENLLILHKKVNAFKRLLQTKRLSDSQKKQIIRASLSKSVSKSGLELLHILIDNQDTTLLPHILKRYQFLAVGDAQFVNVQITTSKAMEPSEQESIVSAIENRLQKSVKSKSLVDDSLLGGIKLRIGNQIMDASLLSRLNNLKKELVRA